MDVGNTLNPAIDIRQVEGAFTQGLGLFTMEECVFLRDGKMHTVGPGTGHTRYQDVAIYLLN